MFVHLIAKFLNGNTLEEAVIKACNKVRGAYSILLLANDKIIAVRDPQGIRPLMLGRMKAIGAAAVAGGITPAALFASGLTTGLFWLVIGLTGTIGYVAKLATKPVVRGIMVRTRS